MQLYNRDDGVLRVQAYTERGRGDRTRYRVRGTWRSTGERFTRSATTAKAAVKQAEYVWTAYLNGELDAPDPEPLTLGEMAELWLARDGVRESTVKGNRDTVRSLLGAVGTDRKPIGLTPALVRRWLDSLDRCKGSTQRKRWRDVRAMCRWAKQRGWIHHVPTEGLRPDVEPGDVRPWLDPSEWARFLEALHPRPRLRCAFALETGLRAGEIAHCRWEWIVHGVGRQSVRVQDEPLTGWRPKSKRSYRAVPLSDAALDVLEQAKERFGSEGYVFWSPRRSGPQRGHAVGYYQDWSSVVHRGCARAGVTDVDFHGLRRSAGARWLLQGVRLIVVSRLLGHASIVTTQRAYAGIADAHLASEIGRLEPVPHVSRGDAKQRKLLKLQPEKD